MIGEKVAEERVWLPWTGMWLSSFVLLPIGIFFTYKASRDSRLFNMEAYNQIISRLGSFFKRTKSS